MTAKKKIQREPFLFQLIYDLFGLDETHEVEIEQMTNREFYFFLVFVAIAMTVLNYFVGVFTT
jgi:hypothetical protein